MKRLDKTVYRIILTLLIIVAQGCAGAGLRTQDYGRFSPDRKTTQAFENYQINPEMNYYVSGSDVYPNALMGLDKHYVLDSSLWKRVNMTPEMMKEIVSNMKQKVSTIYQTLFGFVLLDPQGKQIGVWYSIMSATTSVKIKEESHVEVITPNINIYEKNDGHPVREMR
jgi:hypothetical protein